MRSLVRWITDLQQAIDQMDPSTGPELSWVHKRVIYPSLDPLHGDGFLRFQGLQRYPRPGIAHECLSLVSWYEARQDQSSMESHELAASLGAVLTFATNRTVEVPAEISFRVDGQETMSFLSMDVAYDRTLNSPIQDTPGVNRLFIDTASMLCSLREDDLAVIGAAMEMHYGASLIYRTDITSAYAVVVGAIEALSRAYGPTQAAWTDWDKAAKWDQFATHVNLTSEQHDALRRQLMHDRQVLLRQTFAKYGSDALPNGFWSEPWREWLWTVDGTSGEVIGGNWLDEKTVADAIPHDRDVLRRALLKSYDSRSGFVHSGKSDIKFVGDMARQVRTVDGSFPLPFTYLRAILARLIRFELTARSGPFDFPEIIGQFKHGGS